MQVRDVMSQQVDLASPDMRLVEAAAKMRDGDYGVLPVGRDDRLVGVVTDRDIVVRAVAGGLDLNAATVADAMSEGVHWVFDHVEVQEAADIMQRHQIRRLPVVDRGKRLVGMVSLGDFAVEPSEIRPAAQTLADVSAGSERHR